MNTVSIGLSLFFNRRVVSPGLCIDFFLWSQSLVLVKTGKVNSISVTSGPLVTYITTGSYLQVTRLVSNCSYREKTRRWYKYPFR